MFDRYEPVPSPRCPTCEEELTDWQGKDADCLLLVWRQGERHPVRHDVDPEIRFNHERLREFTLPDEFRIYTSDSRGHAFYGTGRCSDGSWTHTTFRHAGTREPGGNELTVDSME